MLEPGRIEIQRRLVRKPLRHSRASGNPVRSQRWIPAFAGMTGWPSLRHDLRRAKSTGCRYSLFALCAFAALAGAVPVSGAIAADRSNANAAPSVSQPEAAIRAFVSAFNALDRTRFDALFAEDVTLYFPSAPFPVRRIEGKEATLLWFGRFFESLRKRGASPGIAPQDLKVQDYGDFAIATFHLGGGESVGRRTVVLRRKRGQWAIAHLHASSETERRP